MQYHFGDRDDLVKAIMEYRGAESESYRADMVAGLMLGDTAPTVTDVVGAFVRPLAIHFQPDNHYLAFLSLYITEEGGYEGLGGDVHIGASVITLRTLLARSCRTSRNRCSTSGGGDADERRARTRPVPGCAARRAQTARLDALIADLIAFLSAGLVAPLVRTTREIAPAD